MVKINRNGNPPARDLTGERFGNLTVEEFAGRDTNGNAMWLVRCDCGKEKYVQHFSLLNHRSKSCGCRYSYHNPKLAGKRFGKLKVMREIGKKKNKILYLCRCDCGREIEVTDFRLKAGTKSCGCLVGEKAKENQTADLIGNKFNNLTVVEKGENRNHRQYWKCRCDCGREIEANTTQLTKGMVRSCNNIECKYALSQVILKGRLPNWYVHQQEKLKENQSEINLFEEGESQ